MLPLHTFLVLYFVYIVTGTSGNEASDVEKERELYIQRMSVKETSILDGYTVVSRSSVNPIYRFRGYRSVSVLYYSVPGGVEKASFTFRSENIHLNFIGSCNTENVDIYLKYGAFPAVNPDGYDFPRGYITQRNEEVYHIPIKTNGTSYSFNIDNPRSGDWYAIAFLEWQDPRTEQVTQQGLSASCQAVVYTDLQIKQESIDIVDCYSGLNIEMLNSTKNTLKCMIGPDVNFLNFTFKISSSLLENVIIKIQAVSLPSDDNNILSCIVSLPMAEAQAITFQVQPKQWHYIEFSQVTSSTSASCDSFVLEEEELNLSFSTGELMREEKNRFFSFDYAQPSSDLQESLSMLNLTSKDVKTLSFNIKSILDIGGTLTLSASLLMKQVKYYMGYTRLPAIENSTLLEFSDSDQFFKVVICSSLHHKTIPLENGLCKYNFKTYPALFVLNSTDSNSIDDSVIIPYPESGHWFISIRLFCDNSVCPCKTLSNTTKYYVETKREKLDAYKTESSLELSSRNGTTACNATLMFAISSVPCDGGQCSNHGSCVFSTSGGLVLSSCSCVSGYGGYDCSDSSRMETVSQMLTSVLLLTLSNLPFLFSMYIATIRLYFTEAVMFGFTMLLSTFYHACDAPTSISFCIANIRILQFGDFYCGIMSFWMALLAISIINPGLVRVLQLSGAVVIAILTTWNMQSLYAFIVPVCIGVAIVFTSWCVDYYYNRSLFFPKMYYKIYLPISLVLVSFGLICYAFLQTENNYKIVHSLWHIVIAISVVFLLPDYKRGLGYNPFLPRYSTFKIS